MRCPRTLAINEALSRAEVKVRPTTAGAKKFLIVAQTVSVHSEL
jgi:hypothetical protein